LIAREAPDNEQSAMFSPEKVMEFASPLLNFRSSDNQFDSRRTQLATAMARTSIERCLLQSEMLTGYWSKSRIKEVKASLEKAMDLCSEIAASTEYLASKEQNVDDLRRVSTRSRRKRSDEIAPGSNTLPNA
jgi:hypothetical protein